MTLGIKQKRKLLLLKMTGFLRNSPFYLFINATAAYATVAASAPAVVIIHINIIVVAVVVVAEVVVDVVVA